MSARQSQQHIEKISEILCCPGCHKSLRITANGWECRRCELFARKLEQAIVIADSHSKEGYFNPPYASSMLRPWDALELIKYFESGTVLEIGSQDQETNFPNLIRLDKHRYRGSDVVIEDLESLPFSDQSFECVIALNSIEHVRDPFKHLREIRRVLKPNGSLLLDASFIQPLHDAPQHYFNFSAHGLEVLLEGFDIHTLQPSPTQQPWYALMWLVTEFIKGMREHGSREQARQLTLGEIEERFAELNRRALAYKTQHNDDSMLSKWWSTVNEREKELIAPLRNIDEQALGSLAAGFRALALRNELEVSARGRPEEKRSAIMQLFSQLRASERRVALGECLVLDQSDFSGHAGEIWGDRKIQQSFKIKQAISRVDIMFATFMRENNREVCFRLWDAENRQAPLVEQTVNASLFRDNQYFAFCFAPVKSNSAVFLIELESPQSYLNNSVTVRTSTQKRLKGESFAVNAEEHPRDLTFRVYVRDNA